MRLASATVSVPLLPADTTRLGFDKRPVFASLPMDREATCRVIRFGPGLTTNQGTHCRVVFVDPPIKDDPDRAGVCPRHG
jgi:hypothetical protein